jgi:N-methylhydantoinase A
MLDLRDDADGRSAGDGGTSARERLDREREALVEAASRALGEPAARVRVRHELRYRGQSFELTVEEELPEGAAGSRPEELVEEFASAHERRYGYRDADADVELVNIRASAWGAPPALAPPSTGGAGGARGSRRVFFDGRALETSVYGGELAPGTALAGPAVCALAEATVLVPPGWEGEVDTFGSLLLRTTGRT